MGQSRTFKMVLPIETELKLEALCKMHAPERPMARVVRDLIDQEHAAQAAERDARRKAELQAEARRGRMERNRIQVARLKRMEDEREARLLEQRERADRLKGRA